MKRGILLATIVLVCALTSVVHGRDKKAGDQASDDMEKQLMQLLGGGEPASEKDLIAAARTIVGQVARIRKLEKRRPVSMEVRTKSQIRSYVEERMEAEIKPEELQGQEWALKRLGLLPEDYSLKDSIVALYEEQIAGYYDPFAHKFYIADWIPLLMQQPIMAHELTHALQDQHFDLQPYLTPIKENSDATAARQALVEGDAVLTMMAFSFGAAGMSVDSLESVGGTIRQSLSMGSQKYPVFASAPTYMRESLVFPYATGADFALARKKAAGWKGLTATYKGLPKSTEQILHPERYPSDEPQAVELKAVLDGAPDGWKHVHTDVLGELVLGILLKQKLPAARSTRVADGWDGDRYRAFRAPGGRTVVVHRSVWDSEADAIEAEQAFKDVGAKLAGSAVQRKKAHVAWVLGETDAAVAAKLMKLAWKP
jgi:hypothetical protein